MGVMQLGDMKWRVDPNSVDWTFQMDTTVINTIGGQVVQLLGSTLSDLTVTGDFGQQHPHVGALSKGGPGIVSWKLAAAFHQKMRGFMDRQTLPAKTMSRPGANDSIGAGARGGIGDGAKNVTAPPPGGIGAGARNVKRVGILSDAGIIHDPLPLTYFDGVHNWSFKVLIKSIEDNDGSGSLDMTTGKFSYSYKIVFFIVEADSTRVRKVASDYFLSRISNGLGWKQTTFNGPAKIEDAQSYITLNGGTVSAFLTKVLTGDKLTAPPAPKLKRDTKRGD